MHTHSRDKLSMTCLGQVFNPRKYFYTQSTSLRVRAHDHRDAKTGPSEPEQNPENVAGANNIDVLTLMRIEKSII